MLPSRLNRPRIAVSLILACSVLATGTALAQDDPPPDQPAEEVEEPVEEVDQPVEEAEEPAEQAPAEDDGAADGPKKKKKKKSDDEPECEVDDPAPEVPPESIDDEDGGQLDEGAELGEEEANEECEPPRCEDTEVDLAPDEEEPNCVSRARLNRLLADFEAAAAQEAAALDELSDALEQLEELNSLLDALRARLGEVQIRLAAARADAEFARMREAIAGESLDDVSATLDAEEDRLREQAVQAYMGGDDVELATSSALLELDNYTDVETAKQYADAVIEDQVTTIGLVEALRNAVVTLGEVVASIEEAAQADAERVATIELQLDDLILEQRRLVKEAEAEAETIAERIAEIQRRKEAYAEELRVTGAGGGAIGQMLRIRQADQEAPENPFRTLALPLAQTRLGSGFGPRVHPIFDDTRLHAGIDMSGSAGSQILASADGVVVYAEETRGYGNVVVVDHGNTFATLYAHMTADAVWVGLEVLQGDLLGFVGSTGYSTGPHLHYEVRVKGQPVDPMPYLDL